MFDFNYDGPGLGKGGTGVLTVDGKELAQQEGRAHDPVPHVDRRDLRYWQRYPHGVDDSYQLPFVFNGTIDKLTFKLGKEQLTADDRSRMQEALARAHD